MYLRHAEALTAPAIKVQILRASPFRLEPIRPTAELLPVADYRDVCAGKMHAICDRVEPRDFVDFWAMLHRGTPTVSDDVLERRLRRLMDDLVAHDPGLGPEQLGRALERGLDRDLLEGFALRLLQPVSSDEVQQAILRSLTVISRIVRRGWSGPTVSGPGPSQAQQGARSDDLPPESHGRPLSGPC